MEVLEHMGTLEMYQKLRPHLHLAVIGHTAHDCYGWDCWRNRLGRVARKPLGIRCTKDYLWGHYYAKLAWGPARRADDGQNMPGRAPTYEEFCEWYGLAPEPV